VSPADADEPVEPLPPRATTDLFGHTEAEQTLLEAYRGGRIPHAWLIGGPRGIGKATLAYRMARFMLAHPDPGAPDVQKAGSLAVEPDNRVARRIANEAHSDVLVLERVIGDTGKLNRNIKVDQVRRSVAFFGSTAGEGGWRVAVVDAMDELNDEGENALLKILEEPPSRSLLLLVSNAPGRILPTIRSRCRLLTLRPLSHADVVRGTAAVLGRDAGDEEVQQAAALAEGSIGRALMLLDGPALALRQCVIKLLEGLPNADPQALHALGDAMAGTENSTLAIFIDTVNAWLSARLTDERRDRSRLARVAETWEKINSAAREVETYNLERKPLVFAVFGLLAEAARA
jgi:DNA polymerase-3 subunit delta'